MKDAVGVVGAGILEAAGSVDVAADHGVLDLVLHAVDTVLRRAREESWRPGRRKLASSSQGLGGGCPDSGVRVALLLPNRDHGVLGAMEVTEGGTFRSKT